MIGEEPPDVPNDAKVDQSKLDKLDACIADYNALFGTQYNTNDSQTFTTTTKTLPSGYAIGRWIFCWW